MRNATEFLEYINEEGKKLRRRDELVDQFDSMPSELSREDLYELINLLLPDYRLKVKFFGKGNI